MCDGILIDAHIIPKIRESLYSDNGIFYEIISWILQNCGIATTEYIETHWRQHCPERYADFWEWYFQQLQVKRTIKFISNEKINKLGSATFMKIRRRYGLSRDCFVKAYLDCANTTLDPKYIIAEDMDFYEPKSKRLQTGKQIKIKENRDGSLCRYLERELNIRVGTPSHCKSYFVDKGLCRTKPSTSANQCNCLR